MHDQYEQSPYDNPRKSQQSSLLCIENKTDLGVYVYVGVGWGGRRGGGRLQNVWIHFPEILCIKSILSLINDPCFPFWLAQLIFCEPSVQGAVQFPELKGKTGAVLYWCLLSRYAEGGGRSTAVLIFMGNFTSEELRYLSACRYPAQMYCPKWLLEDRQLTLWPPTAFNPCFLIPHVVSQLEIALLVSDSTSFPSSLFSWGFQALVKCFYS